MLRKSLTVLLVLVMLGATALSVSAANPKPIDLAITEDDHTDNPDPVFENGFVTYTVEVTNNGPEPVNKFGLTLELDAGQYITASGYRWHCTVAGQAGTCVHEGAIPAGIAAAPVDVVAQAPAFTEDSNTMTNTVTTFVTDGYTDVDDDNDSDSETTEIAEGTDLTLDQKDNPDPVGHGNLMRYFVTANNNSAVDAEGVQLSNQLSGGTFDQTFVETFDDTDWDCTFSSTTASCSYEPPTLGAGASSILELWVVADNRPSDFEMTNTATVSATTPDSDTSNNSNTEDTGVCCKDEEFDSASAFIPPEGGSVSTCSASGSPTDDNHTCALVIFPASLLGGIARLEEGPQIDLCEDFGCVGNSVDVIVPDGYDFPGAPIEIFFRVHESVEGTEPNDTREVFVKKVVEGTEFQSFAVPSCDTPSLLLPCVREIIELDEGDNSYVEAVIEMFSGDPIFDLGDGLG